MSDAAKQFQTEVRKLIRRSALESDITVGEILGIIEAEKFNFMTEQTRIQEEETTEDEND